MENKHTDPNINSETNEQFDGKLIEDHDYDGIRELDNPPPPWLMILFYITIVLSAGYASYYHFFWNKETGPQETEFIAEMEEAKTKYKAVAIDMNTLALSDDVAKLETAKIAFVAKCAVCHGANGEGNAIGPNLTDEFWITGNTPKIVFETIKNGTPNGMTAFSNISDDEILGLASFIMKKLQGTKPENAKAPQGDKR